MQSQARLAHVYRNTAALLRRLPRFELDVSTQELTRRPPGTDAARERENLNPGGGSVSRLCHEPRVALAVLEPFKTTVGITPDEPSFTLRVGEGGLDATIP